MVSFVLQCPVQLCPNNNIMTSVCLSHSCIYLFVCHTAVYICLSVTQLYISVCLLHNCIYLFVCHTAVYICLSHSCILYLFVTQLYIISVCLSHSCIVYLFVCHTAVYYICLSVTQLYIISVCLSHSCILYLFVCHTAVSRGEQHSQGSGAPGWNISLTSSPG